MSSDLSSLIFFSLCSIWTILWIIWRILSFQLIYIIFLILKFSLKKFIIFQEKRINISIIWEKSTEKIFNIFLTIRLCKEKNLKSIYKKKKE